MKKLFAIVVLGLVLASCKKSSSGGTSVTATINDTSFSFNQQLTGVLYDNGRYLELNGTSGTNVATSSIFYAALRSNVAIAPGIYSDTANENVTLPIITRYIDDLGVYPYNYNATNDYGFYTIGLPSTPFTVTITSITTTSVQGTFSGTLYLNGDSTGLAGSTKVIANGRFNAPITISNND